MVDKHTPRKDEKENMLDPKSRHRVKDANIVPKWWVNISLGQNMLLNVKTIALKLFFQ